MKPNQQFVNLGKEFWAHIRIISQHVGYTERPKRKPRDQHTQPRQKESGPIRIPTLAEITGALEELGLDSKQVMGKAGRTTKFGELIMDYFAFRANQLNSFVEPRLMNLDAARATFERLRATLHPTCPLPMNKQKKEKKSPAYFTGIINMLIEANAAGAPCDYDPRELTTITRNNQPFRTLARRVDGAFPSPVNPRAVWEIKEYYYTTTFGSRVADGVYETLLDGMELEELRMSEGVNILHYLIVDDHYTWWDCGRSYLCRILDMLHMGYVDEVLFGREVVDRLPAIVKAWVNMARERRY